MSKALLLSMIAALVGIPAFAARDLNPRSGLRKAVVRLLIFEAFYAFALMFLWGRC